MDYANHANDKADELSRNYMAMDETGKEKLREVLEKFKEIYRTVNTEGKNE